MTRRSVDRSAAVRVRGRSNGMRVTSQRYVVLGAADPAFEGGTEDREAVLRGRARVQAADVPAPWPTGRASTRT